MDIGVNYNAYEVLKEMDTFLKELRLAGYKTSDFRNAYCDAFLVVYVDGYRKALSAWLNGSGRHKIYFYDPYLQPGFLSFGSTEELEDIIMECLREHG